MMDKRTIKKRRGELNAKNFPSEKWFIKQLESRNLHIHVERNYPLLNKYFGDFVWIRLRLVVEIDGSSHDKKKDYDDYRDGLLKKNGWDVVRLKYPCKSNELNDFFYTYGMKIKAHIERMDYRKSKRLIKNPPLGITIAKNNNQRLLDNLYERQEKFKLIQLERAKKRPRNVFNRK